MPSLALLVLLLALLAGAARAERVTTPELDAERDQLIDKLVRGVEVEASVKRFRELVKERDRRVATSRAAQEKERQERDARTEWRDAYHKTADYDASWRCTLSPDPAHPVPSSEGRGRADWGRVVKKEKIRLVPKNELDEGEPATIYEVAGQARRYLIHGETFSRKRDQPFVAEKGDLVLVCDDGTSTDRRLPPPWNTEQVLRSGFAFRIGAVPLIAKKAKWNPIHITENKFFWAIRDVKWKYPADSFVVSNIEIAADLGGGRWQVEAGQGLDWVLEVPPGLLHRELLQPGHSVWAILGQQRFDKTLKKLVLVAQDLEDRYLVEPR